MLSRWCKKYKRDPSKSMLENLSLEFAHTFDDQLQWQWDERFAAVLLHINDKQKDKVVRILEGYFSDYWNILSDEKLPEPVQNLIQYFDGMQPEQLLFSTDTRKKEFLYCAWWPWKSGEQTSLRIALYLNNLPENIKQQRLEEMKQWFAVSA